VKGGVVANAKAQQVEVTNMTIGMLDELGIQLAVEV